MEILFLIASLFMLFSCSNHTDTTPKSIDAGDTTVAEATSIIPERKLQKANREEIEKVKKALLGSWVNSKLIAGLERYAFSSTSEWVTPCRSITFVMEKGKLACYYEIEYEYLATYPDQKFIIDKVSDSSYFIHIDNGDLTLAGDFLFHLNRSAIEIEKVGSERIRTEEFVKVDIQGKTKQPIDLLVMSKLLNGKYKVFDKKGDFVADVGINKFMIENFGSFKVCAPLDLQFHEDVNQKRYPVFSFESSPQAPTPGSNLLLAYGREGNKILLYTFKELSRGIVYNTPIDSLVLQYTFVSIK